MPDQISSPGLADHKAVKAIFFGNYFYGICAVALAIEASLQLGHPLNTVWFYVMLFSITVMYYSMAYLSTEPSAAIVNPRSAWYVENRRPIRLSLYVLFGVFVLSGSFIFVRDLEHILSLNTTEWMLLLVFPLVSAAYYGTTIGGVRYNIRSLALLKPFVIGFTWAGLVNIYPALFESMSRSEHLRPDAAMIFLFVKNLMFIAVLCIMFDIKDYEMDYNLRLKTFVVKLGPSRTIWLIILPLCLAGLASYAFYAALRDFTPGRVILNVIPFIFVMLLAASLQRERKILYYLVVIDGLMLLKACCGVLGMLYFT